MFKGEEEITIQNMGFCQLWLETLTLMGIIAWYYNQNKWRVLKWNSE